jgi:hypothetical protein
MDSPRSNNLLVTLVSVWSAMLGGALGAVTGRAVGPLACHASIGFIAGLIFSVLLYLPVMGATQVTAWFIMGREMEGEPIGCTTSDRLAGLLGGTAGAVGAVVVAALPKGTDLFALRTSIICWTVTAFVPIILGLAVVQYTRWKRKPDFRYWRFQVIRKIRR